MGWRGGSPLAGACSPTTFIMVLMSMLRIAGLSGTNSTMRKIVPDFGGTRPTLVLARSALAEKSGRLLSVTHISAAGLGERCVASGSAPSNITTAFPESSILVTRRRTSGVCASAQLANASAKTQIDRFIDASPKMILMRGIAFLLALLGCAAALA